jgi:hypothetical protein
MALSQLYVAAALEARRVTSALDSDIGKSVGPGYYAREFRTFAIKGHRSSGHSTAATALSSEPDSVLIMPTARIARDCKGAIYVAALQQLRNKQRSLIILDMASYFTREQLDMVYATFAENKDVFFVLLG